LHYTELLQQQYESVHLIGAPSANAAVLVVGYAWVAACYVSGTPSIVGGRVYRGSADPSLEGRYDSDRSIMLAFISFVSKTYHTCTNIFCDVMI
jgi:hypothetical protein